MQYTRNHPYLSRSLRGSRDVPIFLPTQYGFEFEQHKYDKEKTLRMSTIKGEKKEYTRWGEFPFKLDDEEHTL